MSKLKAKTLLDIKNSDLIPDQQTSQETIKLLKQAWNDLPHDLSQNERQLFIELAEKLIKISSIYNSQAN